MQIMSTFIKRKDKWETWGGLPVESFPLQIKDFGDTIPLPVAEEAYREYAKQFGTQQDLQRLGERGGFGFVELLTFLYERIKRLEARERKAERLEKALRSIYNMHPDIRDDLFMLLPELLPEHLKAR